MEPVHGTSEASEFVSEDVISSMPDNVITNFLDRLPLQDAVKTSILSKNWRFKWTTMLSQLVFDEDFFKFLAKTSTYCYPSYRARIIISRILLQLKGAIRKFSINIEYGYYFEDIGNWVMFLCQRGIEEFTLLNSCSEQLLLPTHLFSCLKLKHLELENCCFPPVLDSRGFPDLLSFKLNKVKDDRYKCEEFLNRSPLLEILKITGDSLESSRSLQLMGLFSKLRELTLELSMCELLAENGARKMVQTTLPCLMTLTLCAIDLSSAVNLSCVIELICVSPNLENLTITASYKVPALPRRAFRSSEVDHSRIGQLQLRNVVLKYIYGWENEVRLMKSLLSSSPFLKNMIILARPSQGPHCEREGLAFATNLLTLRRASSLSVILLDWMNSIY